MSMTGEMAYSLAKKYTDEVSSSGGGEEYASKAIYGDDAINFGRKAGTTVGTKSVTFGEKTTASADNSYAEGYDTQASGICAHAEGGSTHATGMYSHAEGSSSTATGNYSHGEGSSYASGSYSHAEGNGSRASGYYSHAEGYYTNAKSDCSHAEGYYSTALKYQHAQGFYNDETIATANTGKGTGEGTAFVIGNGTSTSAKSNAFRIDYNGKVFAKSEYASSGADYAEYFEWLDGNENAEDRRGYFVTMEGNKIKKANAGDYILGIVSGHPAVLGNNDECYMGRYELDEFGAYIEEEITIEVEKTNPETGEIYKEYEIAKRFKEKETYDPNLPYVPRAKRKEWDAVGMMGVLSVRDDGTAEVNGYCKCGISGIATRADSGYMVINRINESIIQVVLK